MKVRIVLLVVVLALCDHENVSAKGFDEGYKAYVGDLNNDGYTDVYVSRAPEIIILHGDIITPIMLRSDVESFVLQQNFDQTFSIISNLTSAQKSSVSQWAEAVVELVLVDFNVDGAQDLLIKNLAIEIPGAVDRIIFSPVEIGDTPATSIAVDGDFRQFSEEVYNWIRNPSYFKENAPLVEQEVGTEIVTEWYFDVPSSCYFDYCYYSFYSGWTSYDSFFDSYSSILECYIYTCQDLGNGSVIYWYPVSYEVPIYEMVSDYSGFNQDAVELAETDPNSPSKIKEKLEQVIKVQMGGVFSEIVIHGENTEGYSDDIYYIEFQKILEVQAAIHNLYCALDEYNCTVVGDAAAVSGTTINVNRTLNGIWNGYPFTQGAYSVEGAQISGYTIEPGGPDSALEGSNHRVPEGTYAFSLHSGDKYQEVPELEDVTGRSAILIHNGSYPYDTSGCILIGKYLYEPGRIYGSRDAVMELRFHLQENGFYGKVVVTNEIP